MIEYLKVLKADKNQTILEGGVEMPFVESRGALRKGDTVLVIRYAENLASMKIYNHLRTLREHEHRVGDRVDFIVYDIKDEMGALCAVDDEVHALIPKNELYREVKPGARLSGRITKIDEGKLRISVREKASVQIRTDIDALIAALRKGGGVLYLNDDSEPEQIRRKLNMSKKAFKRAVGRLLSEGKIDIFEDGIKLLE